MLQSYNFGGQLWILIVQETKREMGHGHIKIISIKLYKSFIKCQISFTMNFRSYPKIKKMRKIDMAHHIV